MAKRTISLLTDYGSQSTYVGILKGVIYGINPDVNVVDLTHDVAPFAVSEAAFALETSYRYLPQRAIHVVVVDPGVGSERRAILAVGERGYYVAPDNGVLSYVLASDEVANVFEITEEHYFLQPVSNTFHGRDIFAPVAAWLSTGLDPSRFGERIEDPVTLSLPRPRAEGSSVIGQVLHVDRFGNLVTNISRPLLESVLEKYGLRGFVALAGQGSTERHVQHYQQAEPGKPVSIFGSSNYLEVVVREGSAAHELGASVGTPVSVRFHK